MAKIPYPQQYDDSFMNIFKRIIDELNSMGYTYEESLQKAQDILDEAKQTNNMNVDVQNQINQLILDGDSSVEAAAARVAGYSNTTYETLKERLDSEYLATREKMTEIVKPIYNIKSWGATGDGSGTNDQSAFDSLISDLLANGNGTVYFPKGHYRLEGMPLDDRINYVGDGDTVSKISLPDTPTNHMFVPMNTSDETVQGATFRDLHFSGLKNHAIDAGTSDYDCWNCTDYNLTLKMAMENCWVTNFKRGYKGSDNDRWVFFHNVRFWWNDAAVYGGEHPQVNQCDIRENNVGITGRLNDFKITASSITKNNVGIRRDIALSTVDAYIDNSTFIGVHFFANRELGLEIGRNNIVVGCRFVGWTKTMPDAIHVLSHSNIINNNHFGYAESTQFATLIDYKVGGGRQSLTNNSFYIYGQNRGVVLSGGFHESYTINGNNYQTHDTPFLEVNPTATFSNSVINDNIVNVLSGGNVTTPLIDLPSANGFIMSGNNFRKHSVATVNKFINAKANGAIIEGNRFVGATNGDAMTLTETDDDTKIRQNVGYSTRNSSTVWIDYADTSAIIEHGLAGRPKGTNIYILPMSSNAADGYYITDITDTTFTLNVPEMEGATSGGRMFAWSATVY